MRRLLVPAALILVGALVMGLFLAGIDEIFEDRDLDARAMLAIGTLRRASVDQVATDITALGSVTLTTLVVTIGVSALWLARDRLDAVQLLVAALGAAAAEVIAKGIFARPRPTVLPHLAQVSGWSFPSGHSLMTTAIYGTLAIMIYRRAPTRAARVLAIAAAAAIIFTVGASRVYLGVHNPSDVLAGMCAGLAWALAVAAVERHLALTGSRYAPT